MKPTCSPHPAEAGKAERIQAQSEAANIDPALHPAHGWWLCQPCGTWHRTRSWQLFYVTQVHPPELAPVVLASYEYTRPNYTRGY